MLSRNFLYILLVAVLQVACGKTGKNIQNEKAAETQLWEEVMVVHDDVMPKMSDINRLKKGLRELPQDRSTMTAITDLTKAEDAMWDWMHGLKTQVQIDSLAHEEALDYLWREKTRIEEVRDLMLKSMEQGEKALNKPDSTNSNN